ncbi:hypothetical protein PFLUV_G00028940 [Perca fluviatilis]|uniref:Uncharacterized protein n=1 Tax=Perca fluviatilis TaxID=8168 RepID=A0A6A5ESR6_PERFL|nr:hypothetical protein PFLUV_G00028940 [Perca fluviatilis]
MSVQTAVAEKSSPDPSGLIVPDDVVWAAVYKCGLPSRAPTAASFPGQVSVCAEQRPSAPCGVLHFYFLVLLSSGRCLLSCGSFSPSLSLCRFDFENRECSSAGRSLPVVIDVIPPPADWGHCCFVSTAKCCLVCFCLHC